MSAGLIVQIQQRDGERERGAPLRTILRIDTVWLLFPVRSADRLTCRRARAGPATNGHAHIGGKIRTATTYMNFMDVFVQSGVLPLDAVTQPAVRA
jgi:hypothetical protein